ncbi:MAG: M23 family metallopeptidase [Ignavibacteria bacterium]|nr:M23 family metallopeptidase [Ignavibacteria bacterium]
MRRISLIAVLMLLTVLPSLQATGVTDVIDDFDELYKQIRDGKISRVEAVPLIEELAGQIAALYYGKGGNEFEKSEMCFPLRSYGASAIGGKNGSGYVTKGYDFFEGNKHGGHPAHDIFIYDKNQDCIDDRSGNPVDVISMTSGIVVSMSDEWEPSSDLRGGKYIMIYEPGEDALYYYAHNNKVTAELGQMVMPCEKIAEVGRTGLNAYKQRSPTHLHISRFLINDGNVIPDDLYQDLLNSNQAQ